jgi:DinB superfamily
MTSTPFPPQVVAALLESTVATLRGELQALPEAALAFHPAPGEWCFKEVVGHLIEAERRGFAGRIRILLGGDTPKLEAWDQGEVARARRDCERDARELVDELARMRQESASLAKGLRGEDLTRAGLHPKVGLLRVGDLLQEWVHHDRNHVKQILSNVQAYAWPHMGNAQGFAGE